MISNIEASGEIQKGKNIWNIDLITLVFDVWKYIWMIKFQNKIIIDYLTKKNIRNFSAEIYVSISLWSGLTKWDINFHQNS